MTELSIGVPCHSDDWTSWYDRDDGIGNCDCERLTDHELLPYGGCENPIATQGRIKGSANMTTTQNVIFDLSGLACMNIENTERCEDYEVRYCCPVERHLSAGAVCRYNDWTMWYNRDQPGDQGDFERVYDHGGVPKGACNNPTAAQAKIVGMQSLVTLEHVELDSQGLLCKNSENPAKCSDYEVRFCCPPKDACTKTSTAFGKVYWRRDEDQTYFVEDAYNMLRYNLESVTACARKCWETAGCFNFHMSDVCLIFVGEGNARPAMPTDNLGFKSNVGTTGEITESLCGAVPFQNQYVVTSKFFCKFLTGEKWEHLVQSLYDQNGLNSATPLKEWILSSPAVTRTSAKLSQYVALDTATQGEFPTTNSSEWVWIKFKMKEYVRFGVINGRGRRGVDENFATALDFSQQLAQKLQTQLTLPDGISVLETTEVENDVVVLNGAGEMTGECTNEGCSCNDGFEDDGYGGCIQFDGVGQVSNQTPQVSNQTPQISNQTPRVSNQTPQVSNQAPQVSNQRPQQSNQKPQVSNQRPQISKQNPQISNQFQK